ncbi:hypothetical protein BJX96DRAFT_10205 [Aspergillus floccosus]
MLLLQCLPAIQYIHVVATFFPHSFLLSVVEVVILFWITTHLPQPKAFGSDSLLWLNLSRNRSMV